MEIQISIGELRERGLWEEATDVLDINPYSLNEGLIESNEILSLTYDEAVEIGLIKEA